MPSVLSNTAFIHSPVSSITRFEVLRRDQWTCQYCGRKAPEVTVSVERLRPLLEGGTDSPMNHFTCCNECGIGRRATMARGLKMAEPGSVADRTAPLVSWEKDTPHYWAHTLDSYRDEQLNRMCETVLDRAGVPATELMRRFLASQIRLHGVDLAWYAFRVSLDRHLVTGDNGLATPESLDLVFTQLPEIAAERVRREDLPYLKRLLFIRGLLRQRLMCVREEEVLQSMKDAASIGVPIDLIEQAARESHTWSEFWRALFALMRGAGGAT